MENKEIRFIDSKYNELFRIPDNSKINVKYADGHIEERTCKYIDDYHTEINGNCFHICQWAEVMEKNGNTYYPAEETTRNIGKAENEQRIEKYADGAKRDKFFKNPNGFTEVRRLKIEWLNEVLPVRHRLRCYTKVYCCRKPRLP